MPTNTRLIHFYDIYIFGASTLCGTVLGNIILKGQIYHTPREVSMGTREMENCMHFCCIEHTLWHSGSTYCVSSTVPK